MSEVPNPQELVEFGRRSGTVFENREHDTTLFSKRVILMPGTGRVKVDYAGRTDGQPVYVGFAGRGTPLTAPNWFIVRATYSGNDLTDYETAVNVAWNDRTTASYG